MPSPEQLLRHACVLVHGNDSVSKTALLRALTEGASAGDELVQSRAGERGLQDLIGEAGTPPFFSERRMVVVRHAEELDPGEFPGGAKGLEKTLSELPETGLLVLVESEPGTVQGEGRRSHGAALRRIVKSAGGDVVVVDYDPKRLADELRLRAKEQGKTLSPIAARTLADMVGGNLASGAMELQKLVSFVGEATSIAEEDVLAVTVAEQEYNVFALAESVMNGRTPEAMGQLQRLFAGSRQVKDEVIPRIVPVMLGQLRMARQTRALLDQGEDPMRPSDEARRWLPEKNVSLEPDWKYRRILGIARRNSRERLAEMLDLLTEADARLKGLAAGRDPGETIEYALIEMSRLAAGTAR